MGHASIPHLTHLLEAMTVVLAPPAHDRAKELGEDHLGHPPILRPISNVILNPICPPRRGPYSPFSYRIEKRFCFLDRRKLMMRYMKVFL
jgi:hypothetical protein